MTLTYRIADTKYAVRKLMLWCLDMVTTARIPVDPVATRILVLRPDHIGDFVMWLPFARMLRARFPSPAHRITLLTSKSVVDLASGSGYFDDVWGIDRNRMDRDYEYRAGVIRKVRRAGFGFVINALYTREFTRGDLIVRAVHAPRSVGFRADPNGRDAFFNRIGDAWYSSLVGTGSARLHETARNAILAEATFGAKLDHVPPWLVAHNSELPTGLPTRYVLLSPSSSDARRNWPLARFAELARRVRDATGWGVVLCGAPSDVAASAHLRMEIGGENVIDLTGRTSLNELQNLVQGASLVICNDTGLAHFAVAGGISGLAIVGGGYWGRFLPYPEAVVDPGHFAVATTSMDCFGCRWRCRYELTGEGVFRCLDAVQVDAAWRHVERLLERGKQLGAS